MNKAILGLLLIVNNCSLYNPGPPTIPSNTYSPATLGINNFFDNSVQQERELHFVRKYIIYQSIIPKSREIEFCFYAQNADHILIEGEETQVNSLYLKLRKIGSTAHIVKKYTTNELTTITFYRNK